MAEMFFFITLFLNFENKLFWKLIFLLFVHTVVDQLGPDSFRFNNRKG